MVSVVIPSRNEPYLNKTIKGILENSTQAEVIAVLDGWWEEPEKIIEDPRVKYIHFTESKGMRSAINAGVAIASGDYIFKCDAHIMVSKNFDKVLEEQTKDNWVVVPRRFALEPETWTVEENPKYPVDYMELSRDLHGEAWTSKNRDSSLEKIAIDDLMSFQGSAWFMKKTYFYELELMDEVNYGTFAYEAQEIGLKAWLSGGEVKVNKNCSYAHWHKTKGRGYSLDKVDVRKAEAFMYNWETLGRAWHKQTKPLEWLYDKFKV
jgi:glycosyltransferase involved in cell wall biosynthesis